MPNRRKLTPETRDRILALIKAGNYRETACAAVGIRSDTLRDWLKRGAREEGTIYADFSDLMDQAEAEAEARDVALIGKAGQEDWRALAWRLERRGKERWRTSAEHEHTGAKGGPIELMQVVSAIAKAEKARGSGDSED